MKFKRAVAAILILCLLFLCSCKEKGESSTVSGDSDKNYTINLLYCGTDTFNPYTLDTESNFEICNLLFDSLIYLDNEFNPVNRLAESVVKDGVNWTAVLKEVYFSNGEQLTGSDVVSSFYSAKESPNYSYLLSNIVSASSSGNTVTFTFSKVEPFGVNLLTFPVIKSGSENLTNEDGVLLPPIGSGMYQLNISEEKLIRNDNYFLGKPIYSEINLINAPDNESSKHYLQTGSVDMYYENIKDGSIVRMDAEKHTVNQNKLVYVGINLNNAILKNTYIRYALSSALNREALCKTGYFGNALPATGPFNPVFKYNENYFSSEIKPNIKISIENLEKIGYNTLDNEGIRKNSSGRRLEFSLLVNSQNRNSVLLAEELADELNDAGIKINIKATDFSTYLEKLNSMNFDLYLAEIKINPDMDLSNAVLSGGSCAFGITDDAEAEPKDDCFIYSSIKAEFDSYNSGNSDIGGIMSVLSAQMPIIPICFRTGILFTTSNAINVTSFSESNIFSSFIS